MNGRILTVAGDFGSTELNCDPKSRIRYWLGSFDDFACFETASADSYSLHATAYDRANTLQVWIEAAIGPVVSVTDGVPKLRPLAADLASFRHCLVPPMRNSL